MFVVRFSILAANFKTISVLKNMAHCALWVLSDPPSCTTLYFKEITVFTLFVPFELQSEVRLSDDEKYWLIATLILTAVLAEISEHITVFTLEMLQIFLGTTKTKTHK
jgi:hypothetical protein